MIRILTVLAIQCFLFQYALQAQIIVPQHHNDAYSAFVKELEAENFNIDFKAFRFSYLNSPQYALSAANKELNRALFVEIRTKIEAEDFKGALPLLERYLSLDYTFAGAHYLLRNAYVGLENEDKAQKHHEIYTQLIESMQEGATGEDCSKGYSINHIKEAYFFIEHLHYKLIDKPTLQGNCEVFQVQAKGGEMMKLYFDISQIKK